MQQRDDARSGNADREASRPRALLALALIVPVPTIGTALALTIPATQGTRLGQGVFALAKVWVLLLPALWLLLVDRERVSLSPARRGGFGVAAVLGIVIGMLIVGAYLIIGPRWIDPSRVLHQASESGLDNSLVYLVATVYFFTINAVLEEYVWRWFVFRKCEVLAGGALAVVLSALFFTLHHILALRAHFGWNVTILGSAGVFVGGAVWSWCYLRYRSIWPGWLSHAIVDIAVFAIGWHLIFGG